MLTYGDLDPFPEKASFFIDYFMSAWHSRGLGNASPAYSGYPFLAFFQLIFRDAILTQKIVFFGLLPFSSVSMYYLMDWLVKSKIAKSTTSIIYSTNYLALFLFNSGSLGLLVIYSLAPFLLCFLLNFLQSDSSQSRRFFLLFTLIFAICVSFNIQSLILISPFIIISFLFEAWSSKDFKRLFIKGCFLLVSIVVSLATVLPSFLDLSSYSSYFESGVVESMISSATYWYSFYFPTFFSPFTLLSKGSLLAFLIPLVIISSLFLSLKYTENLHNLNYLGIFFIILSLSGLLCFSISLGALDNLFFSFPILLSLREPIKLMMPIAITSSILFGLSINNLQTLFCSKVTKRTHVHRVIRQIPKILATLGIISCLLSQNALIFSGDVGLGEITSYIGGPHTWDYEIPQIYYDASDWLDTKRAEEGFFRTLWLPLDFETNQRLRWLEPNLVTLSPGSEGFDFVEFTLQSLVNETANIGALLGILNVKYIVVNMVAGSSGPIRIVKIHDSSAYLTGEPSNFIELLDMQDCLVCVKQEESFFIYENKMFIPHIMCSDNLFSICMSENLLLPDSRNITINLVQNPSFENASESWILGESCLISNDSISGACSLKIINNSTVPRWERGYQVQPVTGGAQYRISLLMKVSNVKQAHFKLAWYNTTTAKGTPIREDQAQIGIDGNYDWWQISNTYIAPVEAKCVSLLSMGGYSLDGINPGITWIDDLDFRWIYESTPIVSSPFYGLTMFSHLPDFKIENQIFNFVTEIKDSGLWNASSTIITLGGSKVPMNLDVDESSQNLVSFFEAEQNVSPNTNASIFIHSKASGSKAITLYDSATLQFSAQKSGLYQVFLRGKSLENSYLSIENLFIPFMSIKSDIQESEFEWFASNVFQLDPDEVLVSLNSDGFPIDIDLVLFISFAEDEANWKDVLLPNNNIFIPYVSSTDYSSYQILSTCSDFIFLGENYNNQWVALKNDTRNHSLLNNAFGNVFLVPSGLNSVKIGFSGQEPLNNVIILYYAIWISIIFIILYVWRTYFLRLSKCFGRLLNSIGDKRDTTEKI